MGQPGCLHGFSAFLGIGTLLTVELTAAVIRAGLSVIGPEDTTVLLGDLSWALELDGAVKDFAFISAIPGRKILLKGNHDYWWGTVYKMKKFFVEQNGLSTIDFLYNNAYETENFVVCGSRGWWGDAGLCPSGVDYEKIVAREALRVGMSLDAGEY